eukprot:5729204-Prymnesium_polylepis.1
MAVGLSDCLSGLSGLSDRLSGLSDCRTRSPDMWTSVHVVHGLFVGNACPTLSDCGRVSD